MNEIYAVAVIGIIILIVGFFIQNTLNKISFLLVKLINIQLLTRAIKSIGMEEFLKETEEDEQNNIQR